MTSPISEKTDPVLKEILRRASHLARTRGRLIDGDEQWEWQVRVGRIFASVLKHDYRTRVGLQEKGGHVVWSVYYIDIDNLSNSIFRTDLYEETLEELRRLMLLDDLANV